MGFEQWRPVVGWEAFYEVSNQGRVRSLARRQSRTTRGTAQIVCYRSRILTPGLVNGYPKVGLSGDGRKGREYVHRLVCTAFHGKAPAGHEVAHNDGDRTNASAENLRWATRSANLADCVRHGTDHRGEKCWNAKLTAEQVIAIRKSFASNSLSAIARQFNISPSNLCAIRARHTWRHI